MDSFHLESSSTSWTPGVCRPRPHFRARRGDGGVGTHEWGDIQGIYADAHRGGTGGGDGLVKKNLKVNGLAVYGNPMQDGNPCSVRLSTLPADQAVAMLDR